MFWLRFLVCLFRGHRYAERGFGVNEHGLAEDAEVYCRRCELGFDPWDCDDIAGECDNAFWRLKDILTRR